MNWLAPGWLWAMALAAIPLLIHLLNRTAGKPLVFPAVRFVPEAASRRLLGIRLTEPWLLALRALLLIGVAMLLAQPVWNPVGGPPDRTAVLVSPLALKVDPDAARRAADAAARQAGVAPRLLAAGLPALPGTVSATEPAEAILARMDEDLSALAQIILIAAPGEADRLWQRPDLRAPVNWQPLPDGDDPLTIAVAAGPDRTEDARYLRAALQAAGTLGNRRPWRLLAADSDEPASVVFALGQAQGDAAGARLTVHDTVPGALAEALMVGGDTVAQRLAQAPGAGQPFWPEHGRRAAATLSGRTLQFLSRFHPSAGDLVTSEQFPLVLREWLQLAEHGTPPFNAGERRPAGWLVWVVLVLFVAERFQSTRAGRG